MVVSSFWIADVCLTLASIADYGNRCKLLNLPTSDAFERKNGIIAHQADVPLHVVGQVMQRGGRPGLPPPAQDGAPYADHCGVLRSINAGA
jgi:hypothetical protein